MFLQSALSLLLSASLLLIGCTSSPSEDMGEAITEDSAALEDDSTAIAQDALDAEGLPAPDMPVSTSDDAETSDEESSAAEETPVPPEVADSISEPTPASEDVETAAIDNTIADGSTVESSMKVSENQVIDAASSEADSIQTAEEEVPASENDISDSGRQSESNSIVAETKSDDSQSNDSADHSGTDEYIVRPGDTLTKIAVRIYGTSRAVSKILAANQVSNPNLIFPGDVLRIDRDGANAEAISPIAKSKTVVVQRGDTLSKIALRIFGSEGSWKYLWRLNQDRLTDPNRISEGSTLTLVYADDSMTD